MCCVSLSAPGLVQSLRVGSVDVTNITIQWDRVNCVDRNGRIDSYIVTFYPTSNPSDRNGRTVLGTGDSDRMFSLTGLPPQTSYTFEIEANNPLIRGGPNAPITASTTMPQGELNKSSFFMMLRLCTLYLQELLLRKYSPAYDMHTECIDYAMQIGCSKG